MLWVLPVVILAFGNVGRWFSLLPSALPSFRVRCFCPFARYVGRVNARCHRTVVPSSPSLFNKLSSIVTFVTFVVTLTVGLSLVIKAWLRVVGERLGRV